MDVLANRPQVVAFQCDDLNTLSFVCFIPEVGESKLQLINAENTTGCNDAESQTKLTEALVTCTVV